LRSDGQVVPSSAAAGVDAAEPLGQGEGAFGFGAVCEESAGLPAQLVTILQERLPEAELREAVIKHVYSEAKLYPGRARRGLPPGSASDAPRS
jgi:hypothetical protein